MPADTMRTTLQAVFAVFGPCCLLGVFFGLENEQYKSVYYMRSSEIGGPSVVHIQRNQVGNSEIHKADAGAQGRLHAQDCPQSWKSYIERLKLGTNGNPRDLPSTDGMNFSQTTSSKFTTVEIFNQKPRYNLCDVLVLKVQSRDWKDRPKTYGGDFFRFRIYTAKPYSAASEDTILDFQNGTYLALFTLRWTGEVKVQLKLIHPVELLPLMLTQLDGTLGLKVDFIGVFVSGDISENVMCHYAELPGPVCNFSDPRTHGPWYCERPKNPRLSCKDWKVFKSDLSNFLKLDAYMSPLSKELIKKSDMLEIENNCSITVSDEVTTNALTPNNQSSLPICRMNGVPADIHTSGHFFEGRWYPDNCTVRNFDAQSGIECLRNKNIVILGDSTSRQMFEYLKGKTYKKYFEKLSTSLGDGSHGTDRIRSLKYNVSVQYHFQGLPVYGTRIVWEKEYIEYVAARINSGRDGCSVVYILSLWAHFVLPGIDFYIRRMESVRSAITSFLDRCPEGRVIFKGANTREHPTKLGVAVVSSEWCITKQERALRRIFQGEKRVGFVNALDITKAQQFKDNVHPNQAIVKEFLNRALTYICER